MWIYLTTELQIDEAKTDRTEEIDKPTIIVGNFITPLLVMARTNRKSTRIHKNWTTPSTN